MRVEEFVNYHRHEIGRPKAGEAVNLDVRWGNDVVSNGREAVPVMIDRLLEAHEVIIEKVRAGIDKTEKNEDWGSNDLLMGDVLRRHELQVWFVSEHVVDMPLVEVDG